jgi:hypothetical protein
MGPRAPVKRAARDRSTTTALMGKLRVKFNDSADGIQGFVFFF